MNIKSSLFNRRGFTLTELMVTMAVATIISFFTFDSIKGVIQASLRVDRKDDFDSLAEDLRFVTGRLDHCTCNFAGLTWDKSSAIIPMVAPAKIVKLANPQGPPACQPGPGDVLIAQEGGNFFRTQVDMIRLSDIEYLRDLNVMRAKLMVRGTSTYKAENEPDSLKKVGRDFPVMFSTYEQNNLVVVNGCIGMSR